MHVVETQRLILRRLELGDAEFIFQLVNDPTWLAGIGDRGVRTLTDAQEYLRKGPLEMYERYGFGLYAIERKVDHQLIGICGLLKRETLPEPDLGYALLPQYAGVGYALEAARACVALAREQFRMPRLLAITTPENIRSRHLLEQLGMQLEQRYRVKPEDDELCLYAMALATP
ncbi:MAG: GNAT family N-acetyltransferase [Lysobacterales bacterium]|nr:GNAT family N-acetyltransferase [Xanthomonadales bacterium]MCB1612142.1 GNAT family N-acetyltransferase [Xanthomonadales bacterium]